MTRLDTIWDQIFPAEQTRIVKLLVEKVIVSPNDLEVRLRANGIERLVLELPAQARRARVEALLRRTRLVAHDALSITFALASLGGQRRLRGACGAAEVSERATRGRGVDVEK